MIVEDEMIVSMEIRQRLEELGYNVVAIEASGEAAIDAAEKQHPDLILMDIKLRGSLDGVTAAERIRERLDVPVIFLTAYADADTLQRAKLTGPFGYILKPFEERELLTNIEMALYKHAMERQLRESRRWFNATLMSIGECVIATDRETAIKTMNPAAEQLTGWSSDEAVGRSFAEVVELRDEGALNTCPATEAIRSGSEVTLGDDSELISREGKRAAVVARFSPIKNETGLIDGMVCVLHDITRRKAAEAAVRNSEKLYRTLAAHLPGGFVLLFDSELRCMIAEGSDLAALGLSASEAEGRSIREIAPPEVQGRIAAACKAAIAGETANLDLRINERDFVVNMVPVKEPDGSTFAGTLLALDITERKRLEKQILEISDTERRQIGSDLHDSLGQSLTGIALMVQAMADRLREEDSAEAESADLIEELVSQAINQTHRLVRGLCPVDLEEDGLAAALGELTSKVDNLFDIWCEFKCSEGVVVGDGTVAMHLYRIAQEAINNAIKYGEPDHVQVSLRKENGVLTLSVSDDGTGIPEGAHGTGMGLSIMNYRARLINGTLDIRNGAQSGTVVTCSIAL